MFGHQDKDDQQSQAGSGPDDIGHTTDADVEQPAGAPPQWQHPGPPPSDDQDELTAQPMLPPTSNLAVEPPASNNDELIDIKQQALTQLSPLINHLDQSPEEEFRTLMMMIQASDNKDLLRAAYTAAGKIEDEKARAQALLDIVNEINYFTQHKKTA